MHGPATDVAVKSSGAGATCESRLSAQSPSLKRKRSIHADAAGRAKAALPSPTSGYVPHRGLQEPSASHSPANHVQQPAASSHFDGPSPDATDVNRTSPEESHQYGANDSSMGFAKIVLGEDDESDSPATGTIPGDAGRSTTDTQFFPWIATPLPSLSILQVAVDAYFDRVNWYIMLFHQPSFTIRAQSILQRAAWRRDELVDVLLVATVASVGLRCVQHDKTWPGHRLLESYSVSAESLSSDLMAQIGSRFYEVMLESRIEAYQICMLLTTYHVYFGSSNFAWNVSGVSTRTAYALALHCDKTRNNNEIAREVSNRCWNHLVVSDQFSSMIFGRPAALDPAFAQLKKLKDLDDTTLPESTANLPIFQGHGAHISFLTYHTLKFELYHIIRQTLQSFRVMQLRSPVSVQDLRALIQVVNTTEIMLQQWHDHLPAVFKPSQWPAGNPWNVLELDQCTPEEQSVRKKIGLQGFILQLLYDAARVWAHRPLLKLRVALSPEADISKIPLVDVPDSLGTSVQAALRMSRVPIDEFGGHLAQSFALMHLFTAGIILCVAPTCQPYSQMAGDAKAGVLRIIAACRAIEDESKIARHTDQMLTRLYKKTMQREMDNALRNVDKGASRDRRSLPVSVKRSPDTGEDPQPRRAPALVSEPTSRTHVDMVSPTAATEYGGTISTFDSHVRRTDEPREEPVVSYLQFESLRHNDRMDPHDMEHLDEAYGAFEQMFNLDFAEFSFNSE
ncbi:hypothetical protein CLCR_09673 [Cladophialophora carrionii]|uniref:Xylanolytic transcriptional activator regulatory domain-containing protein n=1 Tax=Cladophialophora carrionii TaxID=86049 RepID=A0A1C1CX42_9EURO|nr:hypothetical protein CLCR_09673 [Cladophialophora carrionii]